MIIALVFCLKWLSCVPKLDTKSEVIKLDIKQNSYLCNRRHNELRQVVRERNISAVCITDDD